jgi:hypothetical protein
MKENTGGTGVERLVEINMRLNEFLSKIAFSIEGCLDHPAGRSIWVWRSLPWYKRLWYWTVS